jgi:proteasome assembly chaperone (PAC2) family protein
LWKHLEIENEPILSKDPVLLISLSTTNPQFLTLYSQGKELGNFLLEKLDFRKFASLYCSALPAAITVSKNGIAELAGVHFYHFKGVRDIVLLAGFGSPSGNEYEFGSEILTYAKRLGIVEVISVGARWTEEPLPPLETPKVRGFATDEEGRNWLKANDVTILKNEPAYYFANTIVAMASVYGMRGCKLSVDHGEPRPHPKSLIALLSVLSKKLAFDVDTTDLQASALELSETIRTSGSEGMETGQDERSEKREDIYR